MPIDWTGIYDLYSDADGRNDGGNTKQKEANANGAQRIVKILRIDIPECLTILEEWVEYFFMILCTQIRINKCTCMQYDCLGVLDERQKIYRKCTYTCRYTQWDVETKVGHTLNYNN